MQNSKIVVMGAGAVGCYFGGMLARAGHDVTLIARPNHVQAIQKDGLWMDCLSFKESVSVHATTELAAIAGANLLLFCVHFFCLARPAPARKLLVFLIPKSQPFDKYALL